MRAQARESWRVEDGAGGAWREPRSETTNGALSPPPTSLRTPKASARMFPPSSSPSSPAIAALSRTLSTSYRLTTTDSRTFIGAFVCLDPQGNLILDDALEYVEGEEEGREVGLVMVPRRWWVSVERECKGVESEELEGEEGCTSG